MSRALVARAPTRIDFGGGWTDVPPYSTEQGGAVCNIAIARYATASAAIGAPDAPPRSDVAAAAPLIAAALRRAALPGATATIRSDFPVGSGLGGSSAAGVALAGALATLAGTSTEPATLAEQSRSTEVEELGVAGGFQDHYAAAYGGALLLTFEGCVGVEHIGLTPDLCTALARRALLVYTGESRISSITIDAVLDAYRRRDTRVCDALARMKALAGDMAADGREAELAAALAPLGERMEYTVDEQGFQVVAALAAADDDA